MTTVGEERLQESGKNLLKRPKRPRKISGLLVVIGNIKFVILTS